MLVGNKCSVLILLFFSATDGFSIRSHGLMELRFPPSHSGHCSPFSRSKGNHLSILKASSPSEKETALTDEECEILELPYGTKLIGDISQNMKERLEQKKVGTYEKTNKLRYFDNEKYRKANYFGKQKLEVNVERMTQKMRRAEIEERMDKGMSYEAAVKEVDALLKQMKTDGPSSPAQTSDSLRQLFAAVDRDRSGTISAGEMATAFQRMRGPGADPKRVLQDVRDVLAEMDVDGSGQIDFNEFERAAEIFVQRTEDSAAAAAAAAAAQPAPAGKSWWQKLLNL